MVHRYRSRVNSWRPDARTRVIVIVILFIEVVGTFGASSNSDRYDVSGVSLLLVVLGPLALLVHRRRPIGVTTDGLGQAILRSCVYVAVAGAITLTVVARRDITS